MATAMPTTADETLSADFRLMYLSKNRGLQGRKKSPSTSSADDTGIGQQGRSDWVSAIRHSEYTTNRHRRHSHYPFETKKLLESLQQTSTNRCTKAKSRTVDTKTTSSGTKFSLRPSKLILKMPSSYRVTSIHGRRVRSQTRSNLLDDIPEEESESVVSAASTEVSVPQLQQSCSQQATTHSDLNINELASYFDLYLHLPKKMSPMAEMMYN